MSSDTTQQQPRNPFFYLYLGVGAAFGALTFGVFIWAFALGTLTEDRRFLLMWLLPIGGAIAAGAFSGTMTLTANWQYLAITATGALAVWAGSYLFLPVPKQTDKHIYVELQPPPGDAIRGEFTVKFTRPTRGSDTQTGTDGKLTISGYPLTSEELEVHHVSHNTFQTQEESEKKPGPWKYPITDNQVVIRMARKYVAPRKPTKEEVKDWIKAAGLDRETILNPTATEDEVKKVVLTVKNRSGRDIAIWAYDCSASYRDKPRPGAPGSSFSDIVRMRRDEETAQFTKFFDFFDSQSGYFALFIRYTSKNAQEDQQFIGVHNLFNPLDQELVIGANAAAGKDFTASFNNKQSPNP